MLSHSHSHRGTEADRQTQKHNISHNAISSPVVTHCLFSFFNINILPEMKKIDIHPKQMIASLAKHVVCIISGLFHSFFSQRAIYPVDAKCVI